MAWTRFRSTVVGTAAGTLALSGCTVVPPPCGPQGPDEQAQARASVGQVLDDWHAAAASANEERYFAHFAPRGVFLGTDATERWEVPAFRAYAHPHFAKGKAWAFRAHDRHIELEGNVAYFDEALDTPNLGPARGTGVLVRQKREWKIAQYNLSVPIPNERFKEVKALLEAAAK
jgi:ketosteroid isomerase-like protein